MTDVGCWKTEAGRRKLDDGCLEAGKIGDYLEFFLSLLSISLCELCGGKKTEDRRRKLDDRCWMTEVWKQGRSVTI